MGSRTKRLYPQPEALRSQNPSHGDVIQWLLLLLRRNSIHGIIVSLLLLAFSSAMHAQDELTAVPNRPTVSTPAQPVQPGVLETEWGIDAAALQIRDCCKELELRFLVLKS